MLSNVFDIDSKRKQPINSIKVRDRDSVEVVYTYAIRYNEGSEDDTVIIDTNSFSYEEAVSACTQLMNLNFPKDMDRLKGCKILDIELREVNIEYEG